jgi:serine phosphatase RsbU (regulator of sigma subunit)/signal transduction protein with GAF and PtsI domain
LLRTAYAILIGLTGLGALAFELASQRHEPVCEAVPWLAIILFSLLSLLVQRSSFHLGSPITHSLAGVIDIAALLALGPVAGALVAATSGLAYLELTALRRRRLDRRHLLEVPLFNAGLKSLMALFGGLLYTRIAGSLPLLALDAVSALAAVALSLLWFLVDHLGWAIWDYLEGGSARFRLFVRDAFPTAMTIELFPLPFGVILALVYTRLNWLAFGFLGLVVVAVAFLVQRWADARDALVQRVAELTTLEQIGRAIVQAELDLDELSQLIYTYAGRVADATIFHLGLFDGDDYTLKLWVRDGQRVPEQTFRLAPGVGLVNWMRETGQPLLVRDFPRDMDTLPARPAYVSDDPPRSALYVPLIAGETVIGTMSVQSFQPNAYGDEELRVLSAMANQAAVAMQKAQLYAREKKRARQLETIGQVSRQVSATLELDELFERIVHLIRDNFGYYHVGVFTVDPEREHVAFQSSASAGEQNVTFDVAWGEGLIGWVAAHGQAVIVNDVEGDTRYRCVDALEETQSELCAPLLLEDEIVGVLDVQSDEMGAFGREDLFILETLGSQIASAIQEARLYEAERQQAWLSTALLQVADSMSQVSDMDAVLTTIVRLTPILAGVDRCALLLWNPATEAFEPAQTYGLTPELRAIFEGMVFPSGTVPALDLIHLDKRPLLIPEEDLNLTSEEDGGSTGLIPPYLAETFDTQSREMLLLPLLAQGELLGVLMVDYAGRSLYIDDQDRRPKQSGIVGMLTGIANQAAMVLQTARLVQAQQEEAYVSAALLQVAEAVSRSTRLEDTLSTIVRITPILVGVETCAIFLPDDAIGEAHKRSGVSGAPPGRAFLPSQQYGLEPSAVDDFWTLRLDDADPLVRYLRQGQAFVVVGDLVESSSLTSVLGRDSVLALSLATKGEMVGLMVVDYAGSAPHFKHSTIGKRSTIGTQRWINILAGIAGQAAIAVENDRLLREAAEQERMRQELEVAQRIQASFVPERCPDFPGWELAAIWRSARQVGGDFYDFIPLPSETPQAEQPEGNHHNLPNRMGLIVADVADKGVPAALFMALSRTLVRTMAIDGRPPALAIARANDLIIADARSDLFVTLFYAVLQPQAGEVVYVNAGHMPPLLVHAGDGTTTELRTPGMALGVLHSFEFEEHRVWLEPGDILVLYTDGVTEASNAQRDMFGRDQLAHTLSAHRDLSAPDLAQVVDTAIADFVGGAPQFDDFTLLIAKRLA